jgi:hypothetical protein
VNNVLSQIEDLEELKITLPRCPYCGKIDSSVVLANRQAPPTSPNGTNELGLWTFMKERKRFWLLPITIVTLFLVALAVSAGQEAVDPSINIWCC